MSKHFKIFTYLLLLRYRDQLKRLELHWVRNHEDGLHHGSLREPDGPRVVG